MEEEGEGEEMGKGKERVREEMGDGCCLVLEGEGASRWSRVWRAGVGVGCLVRGI